ncbi:MAG: extracellular solute-binding protein [Alkalibacterium sp.]|nr:extracellular solute-binding protein [Alkalibacterium sp.]
MIKRNKVLLSSMMASGLILGACAGDSNGEGGSSDVVTLELFSNKSENVATYERLIEQFEEQHENIRIELEAPPEAETVLRTRLTRNDMPDIMSIGGNATYGELGREGVLYDFTNEEALNDIQPAYQDMLNRLVGTDIEGDYGVPYATNANGVIYNQGLFEEYGMEVPQTWDEFISLLDQAQEEGIAPIQFTLQEAWTALPAWNSLGGVLAPENFGEMKTNGEASFQEDYDEVADKYLELLEYGEGDIFGVGYDDGNENFANGEALFYMQGNWAIPEIERNNEEVELGFFAFPASNDESENNLVSGVDVLLTVSESTDHPEEALAFIEFMLDQEVATQYIEEQAAFSSIEGVLQEDPVFEDIQEKFETGSLTSFPDHFYPAGLGAENLIQEFLIQQNKDQFLQTMDNEWDSVINR